MRLLAGQHSRLGCSAIGSESEWKKRDKETRQLLPLTDEAVHDHLSGNITVGVYPLLSDETCWFLAVDFDQRTWRQDAGAFLDSCREWNVPAALLALPFR